MPRKMVVVEQVVNGFILTGKKGVHVTQYSYELNELLKAMFAEDINNEQS